MMHKRHRQNNCIIFQYYLPSHLHICDIGQKSPSFQSNRILETCCRDTTQWPAWIHHRRKSAFHEHASSDVETGGSRWVPGLLSKVDETAAQLRCPWLYGSCNSRHAWADALSCSSSRHWVNIPLRFSLTAWSSFQQFTVVGSSLGCLVRRVIHQQHTFAIPENCGHDFPSRRLNEKLPGRQWVGMLPVHWLLFGVKIPVMDSWFIASYNAGQKVVWVSTVDSQQIWTHFYLKWLLNGRQKTWSPSSQTLPKPTRSCKIFRMLPYKIPTSLAIYRTSLVDLPSSAFQQHGNNHQWSPQLAVEQRGHLPAMFGHV